MSVLSRLALLARMNRAMDFVSDALMCGRRIRILTIADMWDRASPALEVDMSVPGVRVVRVLEKLRRQGRLPQRIKVDNGPDFSGKVLDAWAFEWSTDRDSSGETHK